jgi:hypothetical protein
VTILTTAHVILSLALLYSQFCRSVKMHGGATRMPVLVAFYVLTAASILSLFAPVVLPGWRPSWDTLALLTSIIIVQFVTSKFWQHGTPDPFRKEAPHDSQVG